MTFCLSFFQNFAESAKNMKNITHTLSERQQLRVVSKYYNGFFNCDSFVLPEKVLMKKDLNASDPVYKWLIMCMNNEDMLMSKVTVGTQSYKNGDLVILEMKDVNVIKVGLIRSIMLKNEHIYFVCEVSKCTRNWLHFFESSVLYPGYSLISCREIADYKPLVMRGISGKFHTALHHRISHKHE